MGENSYASIARVVDTTNEDNKYRGSRIEINPVRNEWLAKVSGAPEKNYTQSNFTEHQLNKFRIKRNPMSKSKQKHTWNLSLKCNISLKRTAVTQVTNPSIWEACLPKKREPLNQKPLTPIGQAWKIQLKTKVNTERQGSAFKLPSTEFHKIPTTSRTKSPIRINKQCNAQGVTKPLERTYRIESMDSDTSGRSIK